MMEIIYNIGLILCAALCIAASYQDIKTRNLTKPVMICGFVIAAAGVGFTGVYFAATGNPIYLICSGCSILFYLVMQAMNAFWLMKKGKVIIGHGDLVIVLALSAYTPLMLPFGFAPVSLIAIGFLLATLCGLIPRIDRAHKRGIPLIPYMFVSWVCLAALPEILL